MDEVDREEDGESSKEVGGARGAGGKAKQEVAERAERRLYSGEHTENLVRNWVQRRRKNEGGEEGGVRRERS